MTTSPLPVLTCPASSGAAPNNLLTFGRPNQQGKTKNADLTLKLHLHNSKTLTAHFLFSVVCVGGEMELSV